MFKVPAVTHLCLCGKMFSPPGEFSIICNNAASAPAGDGFIAVKTEGTQLTNSTGMFVFVQASHRFGCILNKCYPVPVTHFSDLIYAAGMPEGMHGYTRADPATTLFMVTRTILAFLGELIKVLSQFNGTQPHGVGIHINKQGLCAEVGDGIAGGNETQGLGDHQVVAFYSCN